MTLDSLATSSFNSVNLTYSNANTRETNSVLTSTNVIAPEDFIITNETTITPKGEEKISLLAREATNQEYKFKGYLGKDDVGYGVYDVYDLGEFNQKGTIPTKYGTKDAYIRAIEALKQNGIEVFVDIVLNHKVGADSEEEVMARKCDWKDRTKEGKLQRILADTIYSFPGRNNKYSDFKWNWTHFDGIDVDKLTR